MTLFRKSRAIADPPGSWFVSFRLGLLLLVLAQGAGVPAPAAAMAMGMRGPRQALEGYSAVSQPAPPDPARQALMMPIRWFQQYVSPMDGPRCQFSPTCSAFGYAAVRDHGPWHGILMTSDRLLRCSHLTDPQAYPRLADGRLADPVADNLLEK